MSSSNVSRVGTGGRSSSRRDAIVQVLGATAEFQSAQDIYESMRREGEKIGLATVYRTLQSMNAAGEVDAVRSESGEVTYRSCSDNHHHHLVCRVCGKAVEIRGLGVERWAAAQAAEHGYSDVNHTIEIFGVCADH